MKKRYVEIDILRVLAILYIILVRHIDDYASDMYQSQIVTDFTFISLGILVFISGFLLVKTNNNINSRLDIKRFAINKIVRIYPLYALALMCFYFLSIISMEKLISGLLLYCIFIGNYILTLWFIPMIIFFYFIYLLINYKFNKIRFVAIFLLLYLLLMLEKILFDVFQYQLLLYYPVFIFGFIVAKFDIIGKITLITALLAFFVFIFLLFFREFASDKINTFVVGIMIMCFAMSSMYFLDKIVFSSDNLMRKSLFKKTIGIILNFSYASFCMYLIHRILFQVSLNIYYPETKIKTLVYLYLVVVPVIYFVSYYTQMYYDKFFKINIADGSMRMSVK